MILINSMVFATFKVFFTSAGVGNMLTMAGTIAVTAPIKAKLAKNGHFFMVELIEWATHILGCVLTLDILADLCDMAVYKLR